MRFPAITTIKARLAVDVLTAARIHAALILCEGVTQVSKALNEVDAILDGRGVEYIRSAQDTMYGTQGIDYVDMGDAYTATILFDHARGSFLVGNWGDIVEQFPSRFTE